MKSSSKNPRSLGNSAQSLYESEIYRGALEAVGKTQLEAARTLGFELTPLTNTRDAGTGPVITTLANFYQNNGLAKRTFDLIVHDESHMLAQNKGGGSTVFLDMSRALTGHPLGAYRYTEAMEPDLVAEIEQLSEDYKKALAARDYTTADPIWRRLEAARGAFQKKLEEHKANRQELWDAKTTNVLYLSATPFAWERAIPYAEGFLFDFPPENQKTIGSWRSTMNPPMRILGASQP